MHINRNFARLTRNLGNGCDGLSDDDIRALAPSVFATEAHESRSARFAYIPTADVLAGLRKEGFVPVKAMQGRSRVPGKTDFTKHVIRLRHSRYLTGQMKLGDTFPEVVLVNAHDGTSAYHIFSGLFRLACLNGLVVREREDAELRVPHKGDVVGKVIKGSFEVIDQSVRALGAAEAWAGISLTGAEQEAMADAARVIRFGDAEGNVETPIRAAQLLLPRRRDDAGNSLWLTFNRIQENTIRGGLTGRGRNAAGARVNTTTREINGIDGNLKLNRALWQLGQRMAEIKGAG